MTTKSAIPARYTPASPFSMSLDPHDDGPGLQMSACGGNTGSTMASSREYRIKYQD